MLNTRVCVKIYLVSCVEVKLNQQLINFSLHKHQVIVLLALGGPVVVLNTLNMGGIF